MSGFQLKKGLRIDQNKFEACGGSGGSVLPYSYSLFQKGKGPGFCWPETRSWAKSGFHGSNRGIQVLSGG